MKKAFNIVIYASLFVLLFIAPCRAELVANGGFESGNLNAWMINSGPGSVYGIVPFTTIQTHDNTSFNNLFSLELGGIDPAPIADWGTAGEWISQALPTTGGQQYTFSFWMEHTTTSDVLYFQAWWDYNKVFELQDILNVSTGGDMTWTKYSFTVMGSLGGDFVSFFADGHLANVYMYLDDVSVTPIESNGGGGTTDVPEPTTMLLLGLGLMGVAGARRKFNK